MKKSILFASMIACISLPMTVLADPTPITLSFVCPNTTGVGINTLSNFAGARIAGYGTLTINASPGRSPYFTYIIPAGSHIPAKLNTGNYSSSGTDYDPENALVFCSYTSPTFDPFTVVYELTNGAGGTINSQTASTITVNQFVGYV